MNNIKINTLDEVVINLIDIKFILVKKVIIKTYHINLIIIMVKYSFFKKILNQQFIELNTLEIHH